MKQRLLIFDLLRIFFIGLIVVSHITAYLYKISMLEYQDWMRFMVTEPIIFGFDIYLGSLAVFGLIFVSGAMLRYSHPVINDLKSFYLKRLVRIYPAFWISWLIMAVFYLDSLQHRSAFDIFISMIGFSAFIGQWSGVLNGFFFSAFWFIGLIVSLYLIFPFLSMAIKKYPEFTLISCLIVNVACANWIWVNSWGGVMGYRWFPLCNIFFFAAGIYIIEKGFYPKSLHNSAPIIFLSEISFYIFLTHFNLPTIWGLYYFGLPVYLICMSGYGYWLMVVDQRFIQPGIARVIAKMQGSQSRPVARSGS